MYDMSMDARAILETKLLINRRIEDGHWLWTKSCQPHGYGQVACVQLGVYMNGQPRNLRVHRVAAWLWMNFDIDSSLCVLHRCDIAGCFNPEHLFIGTKKDNTQDMLRKGRAANGSEKCRGQAHYKAKFTEKDVRLMRELRNDGAKLFDLAQRFKTTEQAVSMICRRINWKHVV